MKKVMIYFPERKLIPKGGPAGYLYNLKNGLSQIDKSIFNIEFYQSAPVELEENQTLKKWMPKRIKEIRRAYKFAHYLQRSMPVDEALLEYDAIHFHKTEDMYLNRELLSRYKGKVILTSHTPCVPYKEIVGRLNPRDYQLFKNKIDGLVEMDRYAFERADTIIFPCPEAEEPYFHTWKDYGTVRNTEKLRYMVTGIMQASAKNSREEIRKKYKIPENAFLACYAGRHNEIKGYADLKVIGENLLKKEKDVYFLVAGREGPLPSMKHEHWIEAGWVSDPHSLIAASDVFVLPNRETYFDLILLEVLSLGVPVVMTATGGNKYFKTVHTEGIKYYNTTDEAIEKILLYKKMNPEQKIQIHGELIALFKERFTVTEFAKRYIELLKELL